MDTSTADIQQSETGRESKLKLSDILSAWPIIATITSHLTKRDLLHLALTNRQNHSYILSSKAGFRALAHKVRCDGEGVLVRQYRLASFSGLQYDERTCYHATFSHDIDDPAFDIPCTDKDNNDQYVRICDEDRIYPCIKCQINVCDACRYTPRAVGPWYPLSHKMVMCPACEEKTDAMLREEKEWREQYYGVWSELCDCDVDNYNRWICYRCVEDEVLSASFYEDEWTVVDHEGKDEQAYDPDENPGMIVCRGTLRKGVLKGYGQFERWYFCQCGGDVVQHEDFRFRCIWCKRKLAKGLEERLGLPMEDREDTGRGSGGRIVSLLNVDRRQGAGENRGVGSVGASL